MTRYEVLTWHGIPTGVRARGDDGEALENLPPRFQAAVDATAMRAGLTDEEAYLAGWQYAEALEREGSARAVARAVAADIDRDYTPERLRRLGGEVLARLRPGASQTPTLLDEEPGR